MPSITTTQMIVNGFTYSTSPMIANGVDMFTQMGLPILTIGGAMALFAGMFSVMLNAVRGLRG